MAKKNITIDIAGLRIAIVCDQKILFQVLSHRYRGFVTSFQYQFIISVHWQNTGEEITFTPPTVSFLDNSIQLTGRGFAGNFDLINSQGKIMITMASPVEAIDYFLRITTSLLIFKNRGIMIHGAGILHQGRGYLFFGSSGSGKTTISKLSVDDDVLNDDLIVLLPSENGWIMCSTPFWNPTQIEPKMGAVLLSGIYRLVKSKSVFIRPFTSGQALAEVLANIPVIATDSTRSQILIERCMQLLKTTPAYQLHFTPDNSFWQTIHDYQG